MIRCVCDWSESKQAQQRHRKARVRIGRQSQFAPSVDDNLVVHLHRFRAERLGQRLQGRRVRMFVRCHAHLCDSDSLQQQSEVSQSPVKGSVRLLHAIRLNKQSRRVARSQAAQNIVEPVVVDRAQHLAHRGLGNPPPAKRDRLIKQ